MSGKRARRDRRQRQEQERELMDLTRFVCDHHPRRGETVPCRMLDGSAGYAPAVVAELVDVVSAIEPETGARMRRRLGEVLPQLWAEGAARARAGKHSPGDPFTDCARAAYERQSGE